MKTYTEVVDYLIKVLGLPIVSETTKDEIIIAYEGSSIIISSDLVIIKGVLCFSAVSISKKLKFPFIYLNCENLKAEVYYETLDKMLLFVAIVLLFSNLEIITWFKEKQIIAFLNNAHYNLELHVAENMIGLLIKKDIGGHNLLDITYMGTETFLDAKTTRTIIESLAEGNSITYREKLTA